MVRLSGLCLLLAAPFGSTMAASFDCNKATTNNEMLICDSVELSGMDESYAKLYRQAKSESADAARIKQEAILAFRNRELLCVDAKCLDNWYRNRIAALAVDISNLSHSTTTQSPIGSPAAAMAVGCSNAYTTLDIGQCAMEERATAQEVMNDYLKKSIEHHAYDSVVKRSIENGQAAWQSYSSAHCGAVHDVWRTGSIRNAKYEACVLDLTNKRTHVLWESFLTYADSTQAVLPKPMPVDR